MYILVELSVLIVDTASLRVLVCSADSDSTGNTSTLASKSFVYLF